MKSQNKDIKTTLDTLDKVSINFTQCVKRGRRRTIDKEKNNISNQQRLWCSSHTSPSDDDWEIIVQGNVLEETTLG